MKPFNLKQMWVKAKSVFFLIDTNIALYFLLGEKDMLGGFLSLSASVSLSFPLPLAFIQILALSPTFVQVFPLDLAIVLVLVDSGSKIKYFRASF